MREEPTAGGSSLAVTIAPVGGDIAQLTRNAVDVLPAGGLEEKLKLGRPLRVKLGIDVTSPDIHVGRAVPLQRMRAFQDAGHTGVLIIGDYTTRIGDPSGRSAERPILSDEEIDANAQRYLEQAMVVLDPARTEVRYNGEWLGEAVLRGRRSPRADDHRGAHPRARRLREAHAGAGADLASRSSCIRSMQAYDSVAIEADVEIGGTDQLYNLLAGREVMQNYGLEPQVVLTTPLLLSVRRLEDELVRRATTSRCSTPPEEMFGQTMRIPDSQLDEWWHCSWRATACPRAIRWLEARARALRSWRARTGRTQRARRRRTSRAWCASTRRRTTCPKLPCPQAIPLHLPALLVEHLGVATTSEARRLIAQGGVKVNGEPVSELDVSREALAGSLVQAGKRRSPFHVTLRSRLTGTGTLLSFPGRPNGWL